MAIPRGVTPKFILTFDDEIDLTEADHVYVTFRGGRTLTKSDEDLTIEAKQISVYLSQEETLSLHIGNVNIQVNWTYSNGSRAASEIISYSFTEQLLDKVVE